MARPVVGLLVVADIIDVSQGIVERLQPVLPEWEPFWSEPARIPPRAFCVRPDPVRYADYQQVMGGYTKWFLRVGLYLSAYNLEESRLLMGRLTGPKGLIISTLTDEDVTNDLLHQACRGNVQPTNGKGWDVIRSKLAHYLYADIGFELGAN